MSKTNNKYTSQHIDNQSFDEALQMRVTEIIGADGVLKNPATEEKQDPTSRYQLANYDVSASPIYIGKVDSIGGWMIKRIDTSAGVSTYFKGDSNYATNWSNRASLSYDSFDNIF